MRSLLGLGRHKATGEDDVPGPRMVSVSHLGDCVVVSAHCVLDERSAVVLRDVVGTAVRQAGTPEHVIVDIRNAPSCSPASLAMIATLAERGIRLRLDELRVGGGTHGSEIDDACTGTP